MATQETQILDGIIAKTRRRMLKLGAATLASAAIGAVATPKAQAAQIVTDNDVLNLAINLEYLEANFFGAAAFGLPNSSSTNYITGHGFLSGFAGSPLVTFPTGTSGINFVGKLGVVTGGGYDGLSGGKAATLYSVPFTTVQTGSFAVELAFEEIRHIFTLQGYLGLAQATMPNINIGGYQAAVTNSPFAAIAVAAGLPNGSTFNPYSSEANFLLGAYMLEEIVLDAYIGAASLMTVPGSLAYLTALTAAESYHAGALRTIINSVDPAGTGIAASTKLISAYKAKLALAASPVTLGQTTTANPYDGSPDDRGLGIQTGSLAGSAAVTATTLANVDPTNFIGFARTPSQTLNLVSNGAAVSNTTPPTLITPAIGGFFPTGLNAGVNGFH